MRPFGREFMEYASTALNDHFNEKKVLDVSSRLSDNESLFRECEYYVTDLTRDPEESNRQLLSAADLVFPPVNFQTIVSTECLEFDPRCQESLEAMVRMLAPGGLLVLTFNELALSGDASSSSMLDHIIKTDDNFAYWRIYHELQARDIFFIGVKKGGAPVSAFPDYNFVTRLEGANIHNMTTGTKVAREEVAQRILERIASAPVDVEADDKLVFLARDDSREPNFLEPCEGCGRDINCNRENLHIMLNANEPGKDFCYCVDCCQDRDQEMLDAGWKCDECDEEHEGDEEDE
jgi:hypothetical protein